MPQYRCYCADLLCRRSPPLFEPNDDGQPITIRRPVGQGGANLREDVIAIQNGLNAVEPAKGGPAPKLKADGLMGPLTRAAIGRFQKQNISFVDFRIDPTGPTLKALNRVLGLAAKPAAAGVRQAAAFPPTVVTDEMMEAVFKDILPISAACVKTALVKLNEAKKMGTIENPAQTLLRKHLGVEMTNPPPADFALVERTFRAIDHQMNLASVIFEQIFIKSPFPMSLAEIRSTGSVALALSNGVKMRGETVGLSTRDGKQKANLPADAIVLLPTYFICSSDLMIGTLIHELAHFVGPPDGNPNCIEDPPGGSSGDAAIAGLSAIMRPRIAECYAQFAFEAQFGRTPIRTRVQV